ncbi:uncharacterized protein ATNIH1004_001081 [Aspergillus tanneri]|uniref:Uncharacterized protein n=1 Tax=Aspergillus tanneri TaxID=1220188 RepID=A0A5M9NCC3_9EURO|nr:uncharacterized protein ATNIH1004_001081 [Aspergillus tanneri]KAA8652177.1 hypothetical protein ATNIH1004_001081 [Aspergillus tanneri]
MDHEEEAPPPPYSAVDPLLSANNNNNTNSNNSNNHNQNAAASSEVNRVLLRLRAQSSPLSDSALSAGSSSSLVTTTSPLLPVNFTSAAAYFVERPPPASDDGRPVQEHQLTIYPRSQSRDFPRRPRCWGSRQEDITQQDWDTFLRYLFPPHLGLASSSGQLPRQVRAEIQRDRKDRPQETDGQRKMRISAVITEWNQYFFELRATRIVFAYVTDPQNAPPSPLCPRCYPAATRVSSENRLGPSPEAGRGRLIVRPDAAPAAARPQIASQTNYTYPQASYSYPSPPVNPNPYGPYGAPSYFHPLTQASRAYPYAPQPPLPYQQQYSWGYYSGPYPTPSAPGSKGGPFGWIASLASQAQKYGERITEQAQQYGDQISAQAQHYGRQVEEQAMAHGRWIEEKAGLRDAKMDSAYGGMVHAPRGDWPSADPRPQPNYYPATYHYPYTGTGTTTGRNSVESAAAPALPQRPRRASTCSNASESSLTSIDSLSTTSELSSSDLATVRAQLLSLEDHHDRDLHEAVVGLRRQLTLLQESRRQMRVDGRGHWRNGWGQYPQQGQGRGSLGRWESPQQRQRSKMEKRALKDETRATRKAFRDVLRRARDEHREQRRLKRNQRRQEQRSRQIEAAPSEPPLEQRLQNLELDQTNCESRSTVQSFCPSPTRSLVSEVSEISSISTPSSVSSRPSNHPTNTRKLDSKEGKKDMEKREADKETKKKDETEKSSDTTKPSS